MMVDNNKSVLKNEPRPEKSSLTAQDAKFLLAIFGFTVLLFVGGKLMLMFNLTDSTQ